MREDKKTSWGGNGVRSARILCESRLRWRKGANRLRETASRRLVDAWVDARLGCDDDDAGSALSLSFGATPVEDIPELLPEDGAGMGENCGQ